jgi:hypothetical protein
MSLSTTSLRESATSYTSLFLELVVFGDAFSSHRLSFFMKLWMRIRSIVDVDVLVVVYTSCLHAYILFLLATLNKQYQMKP